MRTQVVAQLAASQNIPAQAALPHPSDPRMKYTFRAEKPPIADQIQDQKNKDFEVHEDPLQEVLFSQNAPVADPNVRAVRDMLRPQLTAAGVPWLDSASHRDRQTLGSIFEYCGNLFVRKGTDANCIVQCAPPVDCGLQAARECQPFKGQYKEFALCSARERGFCRRYGQFNGEKYPNWAPKGQTEAEKVAEVVTYCANLLQMRGTKLPCLHDCTIFQMKNTRLDDYLMWKAKQKFFHDKGIGSDQRDPSLPKTFEQGIYNDCEHLSISNCRWVQQDFWRECYERVKFRCLRKGGPEQTVLPKPIPDPL